MTFATRAMLLLALLLPWVAGAQIAPLRFEVSTVPSRPRLPYAASGPLSGGSATVTRAVVALHGGDPDAGAYLQRTLDAAAAAGVAADRLFVVAPQFLRAEDVGALPVDGDLVYWSSGPFYGSAAARTRDGGDVRLSSYHVLDLMLQRLCDRALYPALDSIVVVGHSAGGQMVNRFAAISPAEELFAAPHGIRMRYVVMNPSSYMYFDDGRWSSDANAGGGFARPDASSCPGFNSYPYGMENPYAHHRHLGGADVMPGRYERRTVFYFVGELDDEVEGDGLSTTCASLLQGASRLDRGRTYHRHLLARFGPSIGERQFFAVVPGTGHSSRAMLQSAPVRAAMFAGMAAP